MKPLSFRIFFAISILLSQAYMTANHYFFQPGYAPSTRRSNHGDCNMHVTTWFSGGSTKKGRNSEGKKTELFNMYGNERFAFAFDNVNTSDERITDPGLSDHALTIKNTNHGDKPDTYMQYSIAGKFSIFSAGLAIGWNISEHFSATLSAPLRHFSVKDVVFTELTAEENKEDGGSKLFEVNRNELFAAYGLHAGDVKDTTLGDVQLMTTFTLKSDEQKELGDYCLQLSSGITLPTSQQKDINEAFYVPMGNNGHVGFPMSASAKVVLHEYVNLKVGGGFEGFLKRDTIRRLKTHEKQTNLILLEQGAVREKLGYKVDARAGICLHDVIEGVALSVQYRYERQAKSTLTPLDTYTLTGDPAHPMFDETIINTDATLQKWHRHNLLVKLSVSPSCCQDSAYMPHLGLSFRQTLAGKRVLNTFVVGGSVGLDLSWDF